jgi:transcriptional regulator with XRE-family HTH domain
MDEHMSVGERIAYYRRRRGLTQEVLAGLVGRSVGWLSLIERGERTVEKIAHLLALANVLKVEPGDLIGEIEFPPNGGEPLDPPRGIIGVRRALLAVSPTDREPPGIDELRASVERVQRFGESGSLEALATVLPELISAGRATVEQEVSGAWWCLANATGDGQLSWIAADRAVSAAQHSGDELLVAAAQRQVGNALMRMGWLDEAAAVCSDGADAIAPTDATSRAGWSVWGGLHELQAVIVVRSGEAAGAWRLLRDARAAAEHVGLGHNDYQDAFGPPNVGAHEVTVALETGNAVEALRTADRVEVEQLPTAARRARFLLDTAHAHGLRKDDAAAVAVLLEAERHSPEVIRHQVLAHELVRAFLGRERRSRTPGLRGLAHRLGVTD